MALSERTRSKLSQHLAKETKRHKQAGIVYPLSVEDFENDVVAEAFMLKKERKEEGMSPEETTP